MRVFPRIYCNPMLLAVVFLFGSLTALAQTSSTDSPAAARMRALNNSLLAIHGRMQTAGPNDAAILHSQAAPVIAQRAAALAALMEQDAHAALTFAFSPELAADLTMKFPGSATQIETHVTLTGTVRHWMADYPNLKSSRSLWRMNAGGRSLTLYFAGQEPGNLKRGEQLQATGIVIGSSMAVETHITVQSSAASGFKNPILPLRKKDHDHQHLWPASSLLIVGLTFVPRFGRRGRTRIRALVKACAVYGMVLLAIMAGSVSYAQNSCSTTGTQNIAVLLVVYPGTTIPPYLTVQNVYAAYFSNPGGMSLADYWPQASYGLTSATGNVFGWYTLSYGASGYSSFDALTQDAVNIAANAGVPIQNYNRLSLVMPDWGGGWAGLAELSCSSTYTIPSGQSFTVSTSYINGTNWNTQSTTQLQAINEAAMIVAHELGHNLGLNHSNSRAFTDSSNNPITLGALGVQGTVQEYGDGFDAMSNGTPGHYDAPHKVEELNWIGPNNYATVQSSGTWTVEPIETSLSSNGLKALKVQRGTSNSAWLWLEYRQPIGIYDSAYYRDPTYMAWADQFYTGALIHYEDSTTTEAYTHLLDFTPTSAYGFNDPSLGAGQTWVDPFSNLSISILSASSTGMSVSINYGAMPCTHANPTVSISPLDPSTYPGTAASYAMSITNNDSSGCSASSFTPSSYQPAGFTPAFSSSSVSLNPGQSGSFTMTQTPPAGTPPGTFAVSASASNSPYVGSGTGNLTVLSAPSLTVIVSLTGSSFTPPSTVPITATVLNGGVPVSGTSVTFTVTTPNGSTTSQSGTTSTNGTATWSYKLSGKSPAGNYAARAQTGQASGNKRNATSTQSVSSSTVTFTVQ